MLQTWYCLFKCNTIMFGSMRKIVFLILYLKHSICVLLYCHFDWSTASQQYNSISNEDTNTTHWEMLQSLRDWCHQQNHSPSHMIITETQQSPGIPSVPTASGQSQYWASSSDHSIWRMLSQYEELSQIIF